MKQRVLVSSILMGLVASFAATPLLAQSSNQADQDQAQKQDKKKETTELKSVVVTGSLIPRAQIETASPTVTITAADIQKQAFATVYDALKALPMANGGVQGNQYSGGFTQGAQTISLFGLPANFTLILLNGKPMSQYPLAYNGTGSITDLSNIPAAMIDHIDIVPGGNSAIYGSSAIAGVVNIVLKEKMEGVDMSFRVGGYTDGGGQSQRLQLSGGGSWGNLDYLWSLELLNQQPIFAGQRDWTKSLYSNPSLNGAPVVPSRSFLIAYINSAGRAVYQDPGSATCAPLSYLYNNTTSYAYRPGRGYYCGTTGQYQATSLLNENKSGSAYTNLVYHINENTDAYAQILFNSAAPKYNIGGAFQFWESNENALAPNNGYFWNAKTNQIELWQHLVAPEEYGGGTAGGAETDYSRSYNVAAGFRGALGTNWTYDAYYTRSQQNVTASYMHFKKSAIDKYYLGPQMGTYYGYPVYSPDKSKLYTPLTPATFNQLAARVDNSQEQWTQSLNLIVTNNSLFTLPAGDVGVAGTVQAGSEALHQNVADLIASGDALGLTGSHANGTRNFYGVGGEMRVPVTSWLTGDLSGRYDSYRFSGNSASKFTYKLGIEIRPMDNLLLRANYATAFRAPDMRDLYNATGYYTSVTDYWQCRLAGFGPTTYQKCPDYSDQIFGNSGNNGKLDNITAKTLTYGFVYTPVDRLTLKVDYQRVSIKNEVQQISLDTVLQSEADCRIGKTVGGATIDPNSAICKYYESLIARAPADAKANPYHLLTVSSYPINAATESESGIAASLDYVWDMDRYGSLTFNANYYVEFKHLIQQFPTDPVINVYHDMRYSDWKSTFTGAVTWNIGNWSTTLYNQRYGSIPNAAQNGKLPPWILYNGSVTYHFSDDAALSLRVNNIFSTKPPLDKTQSSFPYFNTYNYNVYGRAVWAEFGFHFGPGGKKN
ncbi:MAG: TonB-dependent receptor [Proteobacteria bacterium]|nr:TonB-dependent receptor [Pseudomonadota bacterium]